MAADGPAGASPPSSSFTKGRPGRGGSSSAPKRAGGAVGGDPVRSKADARFLKESLSCFGLLSILAALSPSLPTNPRMKELRPLRRLSLTEARRLAPHIFLHDAYHSTRPARLALLSSRAPSPRARLPLRPSPSFDTLSLLRPFPCATRQTVTEAYKSSAPAREKPLNPHTKGITPAWHHILLIAFWKDV